MIFKRFNYALIKHFLQFIQFVFILFLTSCITEFIPEIDEEKELLVVEGLFADQGGPSTIKLSTSLPLGRKSEARPLAGCYVTITDDLGGSYLLSETLPGIYVTPLHGIVGRSYTLNIKTNESRNYFSYESYPIEMKAVPPIDSLYYEKRLIRERVDYIEGIEGCQIYLNTHDPDNNCRYYRWDYAETWKLRLWFDVPNQTCWISNNSKSIYIESTTAINEDRINRHPVTYISNATDRLMTKYSILVNQYSLNEEEYSYWQKLQRITEQIGGLYDIIPSSIPSNIMCIENPGEKVLGYFSVSAVSSKRIFIKDDFEGIIYPYADCVSDTLYNGPEYIEGLGTSVWLLFDIKPSPFSSEPRIRILTEKYGCADCTVRGTILKPDFWIDDE